MQVEEILKEYPSQKDFMLQALQKIAQQLELNIDVLLKVSKHFNLSPATVFGIASFYSFLSLTQHGKYVIRICKSVSCDIAEKEEILDAIKNALGIEVGETTNDRLFTLLETNCIGWCNESPAMLINDKVYTHLTKDKILSIIQSIKDDENI
ncbi:TPA: NAD(P)H-dependent oxidoreductase subunit E [bacterium]|nr:NAD(P)H-dependent oxidoreductase subunit E [bacterium]